MADGTLCQQAIAVAERVSGVPDQLLDAISRVETGRPGPDGMIRAWPWTINVGGQGHYYANKQEAVAAATQFVAQGQHSIDLGCTQINQMYHPGAFASLADAFDPASNAAFAARFLTDLFHQTGSWPHAAAAYHSQTPELGTDYQRRVLQAWAEPILTNDSLSVSPSTAGGDAPPARGWGTPTNARSKAIVASNVRSPAGQVTIPFQSRSLVSAIPARVILASQAAGGAGSMRGRDLLSYRARPVALLGAMPRPLPD